MSPLAIPEEEWFARDTFTKEVAFTLCGRILKNRERTGRLFWQKEQDRQSMQTKQKAIH